VIYFIFGMLVLLSYILVIYFLGPSINGICCSRLGFM